MRYIANHSFFHASKMPVVCVLDPSSISPTTLIASRNLAEDPRLSKKGFSDNITDVLPPSDRFDLVGISRYSRYVQNVVKDFRDRVSAKTELSKTESVQSDPVQTE